MGVYGSRGVLPISLTVSGEHLYVVNAGDVSTGANGAGFAIGEAGTLTHLSDANRPLSTSNPAPGEVQASPDGRALVVIEKGTNRLDIQQAAVLRLRDIQACSSEDACNILSISESNQRVLLHRARARMRQALQGYFDERPGQL